MSGNADLVEKSCNNTKTTRLSGIWPPTRQKYRNKNICRKFFPACSEQGITTFQEQGSNVDRPTSQLYWHPYWGDPMHRLRNVSNRRLHRVPNAVPPYISPANLNRNKRKPENRSTRYRYYRHDYTGVSIIRCRFPTNMIMKTVPIRLNAP